jgi:hypothetical protein
MKLTEYEDLNKFLTVLECCQTDVLVEIDSTLNRSEMERVNFINNKDQFELTQDNKSFIIDSIGKNFQSDFCYHFRFYKDGKLVGQSFDHCSLVQLHPDYFSLNDIQRDVMTDSEIGFISEIIG